MLNASLITYINLFFFVVTLICVFVVISSKFLKLNDYIVDLSCELLPILLLILIVRTYVFEPFKIPSESMFPQLTNGDFILVSKYSYGIKFPYSNVTMVDTGGPKRGDVAVFEFPLDVSTYFVKRVIGVPDDHIVWKGNDIFINGKKVRTQAMTPSGENIVAGGRYAYEYIGSHKHVIRKLVNYEPDVFNQNYDFVKLKNQLPVGSTDVNTLELTVPKDYYFVMGDNREKSMDSRSWGFVHKNYFVGRAFYLIFHVNPDVPFWRVWDKFSFKKSDFVQ